MESEQNQLGNQWDGIAEQKRVSPVLLAFVSLFAVMIFYQGMGAILMMVAGVSQPADHVDTTRFIQGFSQVLFLGIPVALLVMLHSKKVAAYTFLDKPLALLPALLIGLSVIVIQPAIQWIGSVERLIPWPQGMVNFRDQLEDLLRVIVGSDSFGELAFVLVVVAVIPAFFEEFFFRGYLLRNFSRKFSGPVAVVLTGFLFALFHFNPFQITGLILLGCYFSFLVWYFQSLWAGIIAHFINNGLAVFVIYLVETQQVSVPLDDPDYQLPFSAMIISLLLFSGLVWLMVQKKQSSE